MEVSRGWLGQRLDESPFEKDADQMALIFCATLEVIERISRLSQRLRGVGELLLDLAPSANEQCVGLIGAAGYRTHTADHGASALDILFVFINF